MSTTPSAMETHPIDLTPYRQMNTERLRHAAEAIWSAADGGAKKSDIFWEGYDDEALIELIRHHGARIQKRGGIIDLTFEADHVLMDSAGLEITLPIKKAPKSSTGYATVGADAPVKVAKPIKTPKVKFLFKVDQWVAGDNPETGESFVGKVTDVYISEATGVEMVDVFVPGSGPIGAFDAKSLAKSKEPKAPKPVIVKAPKHTLKVDQWVAGLIAQDRLGADVVVDESLVSEDGVDFIGQVTSLRFEDAIEMVTVSLTTPVNGGFVEVEASTLSKSKAPAKVKPVKVAKVKAPKALHKIGSWVSGEHSILGDGGIVDETVVFNGTVESIDNETYPGTEMVTINVDSPTGLAIGLYPAALLVKSKPPRVVREKIVKPRVVAGWLSIGSLVQVNPISDNTTFLTSVNADDVLVISDVSADGRDFTVTLADPMEGIEILEYVVDRTDLRKAKTSPARAPKSTSPAATWRKGTRVETRSDEGSPHHILGKVIKTVWSGDEEIVTVLEESSGEEVEVNAINLKRAAKLPGETKAKGDRVRKFTNDEVAAIRTRRATLGKSYQEIANHVFETYGKKATSDMIRSIVIGEAYSDQPMVHSALVVQVEPNLE